jgi:hypothetical protein
VGIDEGSSREFLHFLVFYVDDVHITGNVADVNILYCPVPPAGEYPRSRASNFAICNRSARYKFVTLRRSLLRCISSALVQELLRVFTDLRIAGSSVRANPCCVRAQLPRKSIS